jgi:hypothetical protein
MATGNDNPEWTKSEKYIKQKIRQHFGINPDIKLFTNPVGTGWQGSLVITKRDDYVLLRNPRRIDYGLQPGSSDLIGWHSFVIKPEHVGMRIARFLAPEIKTATGQPTKEQLTWISNVTKAGGRAGIVRNTTDMEALLKLP